MMTIGLIALDLDGTLLDSQKNLSERNRRALERCARMGIQIDHRQGSGWYHAGSTVSAGSQLCHIHQRRNSSGPC